MQYLISLVLTLIFEEGYAILWRVHGRDLWLVALVNVLTNPLVVLWHNLVPGVLLGTALPEVCAVITEAVLYIRKDNRIKNPVWFAIAANAFSYGMGLIINHFL